MMSYQDVGALEISVRNWDLVEELHSLGHLFCDLFSGLPRHFLGTDEKKNELEWGVIEKKAKALADLWRTSNKLLFSRYSVTSTKLEFSVQKP